MTARTAWVTLTTAILTWEYLAPDGQLLTDGAHRAIQHHPILTRAGITLLALHLAHLLPPRYDAIHHAAKAYRRHHTHHTHTP